MSKRIGYFRLSTERQGDALIAIDRYKDQFYKAGFKPEEVLHDIGSGGSVDRPNYQLILSKIRSGEIDSVYLPNDLSRLSRSIADFKAFQDLLLQSGAKLLNLNGEKYDFENASNILKSDLEMIFAEYVRNTNKQRSIQGMAYMVENSIPFQPIFGYLKVKALAKLNIENDQSSGKFDNETVEKIDNSTELITKIKLVPNTGLYKNTDKTVWQVAEELVETYLESGNYNETLRVMTARYGEYKIEGDKHLDFARGSGGLRTWLQSELIRGNIHFKKANKISYETHKSLVKPHQLEKLNTLLAVGSKGRSKGELRNVWKGICFCANCGHPMFIFNNKPGYSYILCSEARTSNNKKVRLRKKGIEVSQCNHTASHGLTPKKLEEYTIDALISNANFLSKQPMSTDEPAPPPMSEEEQSLRNVIRKYELLAAEDPDMVPVLQKKQQQLTDMISSTETPSRDSLDQLRLEYISNCSKVSYWANMTQQEKLLEFSRYIQRIDVAYGFPVFTFKEPLRLNEISTVEGAALVVGQPDMSYFQVMAKSEYHYSINIDPTVDSNTFWSEATKAVDKFLSQD